MYLDTEVMNHPLWAAIREYIAAEIKLAMFRHDFPAPHAVEEIALQRRLGDQSARMENEINAILAALNISAALAKLDPYVAETGFCFFCETPKLPEWAKEAGHPAHTPECLWLIASKLIA